MKFLPVFLLAGCLLAACKQVPEGIKVVDHVEPQKYIGKWYEIVRLDHSFERGLSRSPPLTTYVRMAVSR